MADRVQSTRYYNAWERPPVTDASGEIYVNFADMQIGALDLSHSPVDFVAVRFYSQISKYVEGDYTVYEGNLYRCIGATTDPSGPFDPTRWSLVGESSSTIVLIDNETARATAAEELLQFEIDQETVRAETEESFLQSEIDALRTALNQLLPTGTSVDYYGASPPPGWLLEDGATYNISDYPALGAFLGSRFGGNGTTTFAVPNSLNRFGVAAGSSYPLGSTGGSDSTTLDTSHLPAHTHTLQPHAHTSPPHNHSFSSSTVGLNTIAGPVGFAAAAGAPPAVSLSGDIQAATVVINPTGVLTTDSTGSDGGSAVPVSTIPPYMSRNRIIKT